MKRLMTISLAVLLILLLGAILNTTGARTMPQGCSAPVLVSSVRPEAVEYSPGRLLEGYVTLEITVGTDGAVKSANILYRTSALAVPSAIRAVEQWKFTPATMAGKPVEAVVTYSLPFGENLALFANEKYPVRFNCPEGDENGRPCQVTFSDNTH